ncbi:MAG: trigger factor [Melioribacteraceae bacterium]|nr:trigger factor [Melioribacteraceae bacterium]MCF8394918.1 trigger factor [Melioribacteraceae bacterium]MCF8420440.1 trigger factor [Melioribacteraceae bacterium]
MDIKVNSISDIDQELEVTLTYDEIKPEIDEAYRKERKNIALPGFRKGKVPMQMLKKLYGDAIEYKASEDIANKKFWDAVDQEKLEPVSTPKLVDLNFQPGENLSFKVQYEVKPKLELKDYTGLEVEKPVFKLKDDEVEREFQHIIKTNGKFEEAEEITDRNHKIVVNLQRMDSEGAPIVGQRSEDMVIDLSDEKVNPQISDNAIGKKSGETFSFEFVDEHMHGEEKHREEYKYEAEITKIEKLVPPELNEEFFEKVSNKKAKSEDELRQIITENFKNYYDGQSDNIFTNSLLNDVVKNNDFTPPSAYVETILKSLIEQEKENAKKYKQHIPDENVLRESLKTRAEWNAKWQIIMESLVEKENIKVEDSDLEELAKKESEQTGISIEKLIKYYKDSNRTNAVLEEKAIKFLKNNNKVVEVDAEKKAEEAKKKEEESKKKTEKKVAKKKSEDKDEPKEGK